MPRIIALLLLISLAAVAEDQIRSFPIPTIVALGKELYLRDHMAAVAFDALFAAEPDAQKRPIRGWITEVEKDNRRVYFIQEQEAQYSLAYIANFQGSGTPRIVDKAGAALPDPIAKRFAARRAAIAAIPNFMTPT